MLAGFLLESVTAAISSPRRSRASRTAWSIGRVSSSWAVPLLLSPSPAVALPGSSLVVASVHVAGLLLLHVVLLLLLWRLPAPILRRPPVVTVLHHLLLLAAVPAVLLKLVVPPDALLLLLWRLPAPILQRPPVVAGLHRPGRRLLVLLPSRRHRRVLVL